ncbi:uncharacterized protein PODANS_3_5710 [Podospora anserina S mat+]|uniref:Podospora anserina S mat+ genomic DNA chromosome 3, supercontig 2 n=5 Tax=Podospora TaxID=5144 RepID=B2B0J6_PODAN|nr:uncharacterized protein PODANS_3_5710 [Podospora anserina S mat+]KAK4644543.1 hypothetical protein QC761_305710 [Podospora bellae-mahoneyi]KAK4655814.1 hypothetical protein QC762_305710 [Podospora pseudocomata]KAK4667050.1 hypothetical protein QC763_305710 [Podospora pseudopauciseta]VBB77206.1 Putative protein of unknown function [Podospora comata]CAP70502.1 unnamed protein product [Podospora anserina S mat+]
MPTVLGLTNDQKEKPKIGAAQAPKGYHDGSLVLSENKNQRLDTISKRNYAAAHEMETLLWRAICDDPEQAKEYIADDCVMVNPIFHPDHSSKPVNKESEPSISDLLENAGKFTGFRFHDGGPLVVEAGLMAVSTVYKLSLYKQSRKGGIREISASGSSSWRQTAGADWVLVAWHVAYAEDEDDEDDEE